TSPVGTCKPLTANLLHLGIRTSDLHTLNPGPLLREQLKRRPLVSVRPSQPLQAVHYRVRRVLTTANRDHVPLEVARAGHHPQLIPVRARVVVEAHHHPMLPPVAIWRPHTARGVPRPPPKRRS